MENSPPKNELASPPTQEFSNENHLKDFSIIIRQDIHNRLEKHLHLLKRLNKMNRSKQKWVEEAINEYLKKWEAEDLSDDISDRSLRFKLDSKLHQKVEKRIRIIKKLGVNLNKKQFFLDAINDKLNREQHEVETKAKEVLQDMIESISTK